MTLEHKVIIVVEDEQDTAEMFAEMIRLIGYNVISSQGGMKAISLIAEKQPAAVILDVMMPEVSGLDLLRMMQRDPRLSQIPVIIVSAKSLPSDVLVGMDAGASFYLTKPVSFGDMKKAVGQVVTASLDRRAEN